MKQTTRELRNLGLTLSLALLAAILTTYLLVQNFGTTGQYMVGTTLLSPDVLEKLNFNDRDPRTNQAARYVFGGIDYQVYDPLKKEWARVPVGLDQYRLFFKKIAHDESLLNPTPSMESYFTQMQPATLSIHVRTDSNSPWLADAKVFQQLDIASQGSLFRIQLREQAPGAPPWAYFEHPQILQLANEILVK